MTSSHAPLKFSAEARAVSMWTATAIAVADMIGVGVFTSLGFQVKDIQSGFSLLMLWIVGGAVALCGALSYTELATIFPRSGGEYNFLSRIYHHAVGFMAGFVSATVGFAAPIALAAMLFGSYFEGVFPGLSPVLGVSPSVVLGLAVAWSISLIHLAGIREGSWFQNASTLLKIALIVVLIVAGLSQPNTQSISFLPSSIDLTLMGGAPFAISLVYVLYAYSGWNAATYIAGEVRDPGKNLPRSILLALLIVIFLYVLLNAVFLYTTPISELAGQKEVALIAGRHIFGDLGGRIVGGLICFGLISTISAMTWIGPRVTMVMGEDIPLFRLFAHKTKKGVPAFATLFQLSVVTVLLLTQSFNNILTYLNFSLTFCSFLAVLGVIILRITQPNLPRPHRVWGYPFTPLIFLAGTSYILWNLITTEPETSAWGLATLVSGLLIYGISTQLRQQTAIQGVS